MSWNYKLKLNGVDPEKIRHAQAYIDSEILRNSDPLVPFKTGSLKRSGITGTQIGTGIIKYTAPYAKFQYFNGKASNQQGRKWVQRMWLSQRKQILKNAQKILNGR
ncbi:MAG: capsid protein [Ruminococcus sp.]|nr:capsid protein [Ruminococcus sp.]